jgi:glycosyl transferase family 1
VVRLVAGALSARARVEVVSLCTSGAPNGADEAVRTRRDSVFVVHEVAASRAGKVHAGLLRAALARGGGGRLPKISGPRLVELEGGVAPGVVELISSLGADTVLLAGPETWWLPEALGSLRPGVRVVALPLLGDDPRGELAQFVPLLTGVDAVGVLSRAEGRRVRDGADGFVGPAESVPAEVAELEVAFSVNRAAAEQLMVGMSHFGRFAVVLTGFPEGTPAAERSPCHDYVRRWLGPIAVAEVALDRWLISDLEKVREVPVGPSRPNLWKLLRHAEVCLDLRPQGIVGRETIESLILGTPVVVPESTVAAEHAERSNGGLWYRDYREMFDAAKAILDSPALRARLSEQGRAWAAEMHGDHARFSEQVERFALGEPG